MLKILGIAAALFFINFPAYAEVTVFPYKTENPSQNFASDSGLQYAKLLSITLSLSTRLEVTSQRDVLADISRLKLKPDRNISSEDLMDFSRNKGIDYILTGKLSRTGGKYISESILFSVKEKKTIQRAVTRSSSLFELAQKDVREFFPMYQKALPKYSEGALDMTFLIDCSFALSNEWPAVKEGIVDLSESLMQRGQTNLRVYLVPFSKNYGFDKVSVAENSAIKLKENLNRLSPASAYSDEAFAKALQYAVKSILWRQNAERKIIIITNSRLSASGFPQQYGLIAKQAGIEVDSILLGRLDYNSAELSTVLAANSGGTTNYATYHQRVFNSSGTSRELFFQRNRLLYSVSHIPSWRQGVLNTDRYNTAAAAPREGLEELRSDKIIADPYSLPSVYNNVSGERIINSGPLENNITYIIKESQNALRTSASENNLAGNIIVSDGSTSILVDISNAADMAFFEKKYKSEEFFNLGIVISYDKESPYGIRLLAASRNLNREDIPALISTGVKDLIQKKDTYMREGLFNPPVWFLRVQVQQIRAYSEQRDVRDNY